MKKKWFVGLVLVIVALLPVVIPTIVVLIALLIVAIVACAVYDVVKGVVAQATINGYHRRILHQLRKTGGVPFVDDYDFSWDHDHAKCTPRTCVFKQREEYYRLNKACEEAGVKEWRIRWAS